MTDLPKTGEPVLIRPLPGKPVVKDGAHGQFVPPKGAIYPWSQHWQMMLSCGAIEHPQVCPSWGSEVMVCKAGEGRDDMVPAKWSPEMRDQLLMGAIEFPLLRQAWEAERRAEEQHKAEETKALSTVDSENGVK